MTTPPQSVSVAVPPLLSLNAICKSFPGTRALVDVTMEFHAGEVLALVGENGAGKSTLVKILTGIYRPERGQLSCDGHSVQFANAYAAVAAGITAIHQETVLFDELTVAENIFIGRAPKTTLGLIDWRQMNKDAQTLLAHVGAEIKPDAPLSGLGIATRHLVSIARALSFDARIVIMDEPSAALSHKEIEELYALIERLKSEGRAILFISHKLDEVFRVADRYVVLRDGHLVGSGRIADTTADDIVNMMVGRAIGRAYPKHNHAVGDPILRVQNLCYKKEFADISFDLRRGEILGFYGLIGAGRSEAMQAVFGINKAESGTIIINNKTAVINRPADAVGYGIAYVPEDRGKQGAVAAMPIYQNTTLPSLNRVSRYAFLQSIKEFALCAEYTEPLKLRAASLEQSVATLSGGNQQKVVLAKWLATQPQILILDEPTKGIDIGSKYAVYHLINQLANDGMAIILISSELPEIIGMADLVHVMREGLQCKSFTRDELQAERLVRAAAGIA